MDHWRREKYSTVSKALKRVERRTDKLVERINTSSVGSWEHSKQVSAWANEVAKLQRMGDRLLDFRSSLYFYSNLDYVEALNEWENEVDKICKKAEEFANPAAAARHRHQRSAVSETVVHRLVSSVY